MAHNKFKLANQARSYVGLPPIDPDNAFPEDTQITITSENAPKLFPEPIRAEDGDLRFGNLQTISRRAAVFRLRAAGKSYSEIADLMRNDEAVKAFLPLAYGPKEIKKDLAVYLTFLRDELSESLPDVIQLEIERFDKMLDALWPAIEKGSTRAIETALKISERRAKLLGLDAAIKVDWKLELYGLLRANTITVSEIRAELDPELFAQFTQYVDERNNRLNEKAAESPASIKTLFSGVAGQALEPFTLLENE